jgi:HD-GYP domain-containing protein (c-di-GMP phosphodiesterase class II)
MAVARLPRLRIVTALLGAMIFVAIVPLVLLHFNLIRINREALETAEKKYLKGSSVTLADLTDSYITSAQGQLRKIADGLRLASAVSLDPFYYLAKSKLLSDYVQAEQSLLVLRALDRDGLGAAAVALRADGTPIQPDGLLEQKLRQAYNVAMRGESMISEPIWTEAFPEGGLVIAVPVKSADDETIGAVEAFLALAPIRAKLQEESKAASLVAYIVDRTGSLILSSSPDTFPSKDLHKVELVSEFIAHPARLTKSYTRGEGPAARRVLGTLATVSTMDWGLIVEKEESSAYASVAEMTKASTLLAGFGVLLASLFAFLAAQLLSRPVRDLVQKVQSVAEGHFKQRVEVHGVRELAELSETFNSMSDSIERSVEQLKLAAKENQELFISSVRSLTAAIDAKDPYTRGHSERVAKYAVAIARHMRLANDEIRQVRLSALLHDVGKIGIDDRILRKPTALTSEEFEVMKTHPIKGALIMGQIPQLRDIIPGIKHHHEKWSGGGYPDGLKGEEIPKYARIIAVADTLDAMTTTRPYQKAMPLSYVVSQIKSFSGKSFDPEIIVAFDDAFATGDLEFLGEPVPLRVSA